MPSRAYVTRVSPEDFPRHINSSSDTHTYTFFPNGSTGTRQTRTPPLIIRRNWKAYPGPTYPCLVCGRGYSRSGVAVQWSSCSRWFCMTPTCSSTTPRTPPPLPGCDASVRIHTPSLTHLTSPVLLQQILPSSGAQPSQAPFFVLDQAPLQLRLTFLPGNRPFLTPPFTSFFFCFPHLSLTLSGHLLFFSYFFPLQLFWVLFSYLRFLVWQPFFCLQSPTASISSPTPTIRFSIPLLSQVNPLPEHVPIILPSPLTSFFPSFSPLFLSPASLNLSFTPLPSPSGSATPSELHPTTSPPPTRYSFRVASPSSTTASSATTAPSPPFGSSLAVLQWNANIILNKQM